jgi:hypothetical protein
MNSRKLEASKIVNTLESLIQKRYDEFKELSYNANTKGYDYESIIYEILKEYLNSRFDFYLRPHIVDKDMNYVAVFKTGENEVDIATTFKSTIPKLIIKTSKTSFIFLDSIAFLVECKAVLNSQSIANDLDKLEKISSLPIDANRFSDVRGSEFMVEDRPLRILVYERKSIKEEVLNSTLNASKYWDLIFIVKDKITIINKSTIPFAEYLQKKLRTNITTTVVIKWQDVPFTILLIMILMTVPDPMSVNVIKQLTKLVSAAFSRD